MSRQLSLDIFFYKSKAQKPDLQTMTCKKRTTGGLITTTPTKALKTAKNENSRCVHDDVVSLVSDDDEVSVSPKLEVSCDNQSQCSTRSEGSVPDASDNRRLTPHTPLETTQAFCTPKKSPQTQYSVQAQTSNDGFQSSALTQLTPHGPHSRQKFFSPNKNRSVVQRQSTKVTSRKLFMESMIKSESIEDDIFSAVCKDMDTKTIFLLTIIYKYLNDDSLRVLLDSEVQELIGQCLQVVKPGMRVVCRLYWRKPGWYKKDQVFHISSENKDDNVDDYLNLEVMLESLVQSGLVVKGDNRNMSFAEFTSFLNKEELKKICVELKLKTASKQNAIEALASFSKRSSNISNFLTGYTSSNSSRVLQLMSEMAGPCYKLSDRARTAIHRLHVLMYLGMDYSIIRDKKLELTLLYDEIERETYPVDKNIALDNASVVFENKDDFERYMTAHDVYEDFLTRTIVKEKCAIIQQVFRLYRDIDDGDMMRYKSLPIWLRQYTPAYKYVKILEAGIQDLKKEKDGSHFLLALDILNTLIKQSAFRQHKKAEWYAEKALILHSLLNRYDEAAEVLLEGFKSDMSEEAKDSMRPRARKIANQKNVTLSDHLQSELLQYATKENILEINLGGQHIYKQPMDRTSKRGKVKFERRTTEGRVVQDAEEYCIGHYIVSGEYTDGEHWEGRIVTTIFFLLFWDIIYTKPDGVRGVFLSRYQLYPLDLFCESFYTNRRQAIEDWLRVIEGANEDKLINIMHDTWSRRPEYEVSGISRLGWENIKAVATCLGPARLAALCRRLARDYRYAHSGFPDLTLWNRHTGKVKFVEVKTDTDKPSMKQIQWMSYLRENGIDTEFCYLGVNTTRQRCRLADSRQTAVTPKTAPKRKLKKEPKVKRKRRDTGDKIKVKLEGVDKTPVVIKEELIDVVESAEIKSVAIKEEFVDNVEGVENKSVVIKEEFVDNVEGVENKSVVIKEKFIDIVESDQRVVGTNK